MSYLVRYMCSNDSNVGGIFGSNNVGQCVIKVYGPAQQPHCYAAVMTKLFCFNKKPYLNLSFGISMVSSYSSPTSYVK